MMLGVGLASHAELAVVVRACEGQGSAGRWRMGEKKGWWDGGNER